MRKNSRNYVKWYYSDNNKTVYLPKSKEEFAKKLLRKKYLLLKRDELIANKEALLTYDILTSDAKNKISDFIKNEKYISLFTTSANFTKDSFSKANSHASPSGNKVRSKSEIFIDMALNNRAIEFYYEKELILNGISFHPDFTIVHPLTGETIYWEHFGLMDDKVYAKKAHNKMQIFYKNGIIPGKNLILTFETKSNPFTYNAAEAALVSLNL